ncbi:hypothetical protein MA5S0422_4057 [Mycobacteroides abscessus 5S-0422]|uniref:Uncharacterized protein n=1 Tax=Mycobacteroides abscessus subsp. bolletii 1513 TaxID=1299321 RepID=X8DJK6_9MYCO|nr:hypothetical protein MA5S0422_4057 [Mycobacteroides abscessus 5S-0422]EIU05547.1 hypothetical protein MA5S0421_3138 [Mycobacteroides abscessus 5S-0421]EIU12261.1 hypothetical protein MA5S0304_2883 [Mycobacteroides abscessus 5S-0304]EIU22520.1 hypothetical protein MA5S0708_2810 [Mycobacteroides abscessus 5S-0708]EIU25085.1 hypothetical protein MA5S0817_2429 [Mycobacteroides abscessus 5S-0817]EIU31992.1 hypothetical protein MA5S1212_2566 [Mycobacteroides abscessus 5S-1212]EIU43376.1 hypothet
MLDDPSECAYGGGGSDVQIGPRITLINLTFTALFPSAELAVSPASR